MTDASGSYRSGHDLEQVKSASLTALVGRANNERVFHGFSSKIVIRVNRCLAYACTLRICPRGLSFGYSSQTRPKYSVGLEKDAHGLDISLFRYCHSFVNICLFTTPLVLEQTSQRRHQQNASLSMAGGFAMARVF